MKDMEHGGVEKAMEQRNSRSEVPVGAGSPDNWNSRLPSGPPTREVVKTPTRAHGGERRQEKAPAREEIEARRRPTRRRGTEEESRAHPGSDAHRGRARAVAHWGSEGGHTWGQHVGVPRPGNTLTGSARQADLVRIG